MKKHPDHRSGPSQRQLRVGELVRHALADALQRGDVPDPVLDSHVVTVPEVRMSPDLRIATCFVMPLGGNDRTEVIKALASNQKALRGAMAPRMDLKFMPEMRFLIDTSFDEGNRIDVLLRSPEVTRDLGPEEESE